MNEWISVKDSKPRTGALCLVSLRRDVQQIAYRRIGLGFACCDGYEWEPAYDMGMDGIPDNEVTHWMPLPSPPEAA